MRSTGVIAMCVSVLLTMAVSETRYSDFHLAGDYLLGGLFSLHTETMSSSHLSHSAVPTCQAYKLKIASYSHLRAMRFAVEQINNSSTLLPGVSLGYEMVDVCYFTNSIHPILYFLANEHSVVQLQNNYTHYQPRVLAVIGPDSSQAAVIVAHVLSLFFIPQISYRATTNELNDRERFPSAFRAISSMEQQIVAMLLLLKEFQWNWINVLYSDDDYGRQNLKLLWARATGICVAMQDVIPVPRSSQLLPLELQGKIKAIVSKVIHSTANVVIVLSLEMTLPFFFQEVVRQNVTDLVWIAAEAWAIEPTLYNITDLWRVGTILGVAAKEFSIPGFDDFRVSLAKEDNGQASNQTTCNQACDQCLGAARDADQTMRAQGERTDFSVYSSVYIVAHALHRLLGCNTTGCHKRMVYPWQLVPEVKRVDFSLLDKRINFREKGDTPNSFEIIQWKWDQPNHPFQKIASYSTKNQKLLITTQNISWHTPNNTVPISVCSQECEYGQRRKPISVSSCCFKCIDCEAGTFLNNNANPYNCQPCPAHQWSSARSQECYPRLVKYLEWQEGTSVVLLLFSVLGLIATLVISVTFAIHSQTPVVKSAGGRMCFLMLVSLIIGFLNVPMYVGIPTEFKCKCRQTVFSLCFTVCISCITVRSFQIISIFKMAARLPKAYSYWTKYNGQYVFITVILALKVAIIVTNIIINPPAPVLVDLKDDPSLVVLQCNKSYKLALLMNSSLETCLSILCFYFSYMGKELPKNYNEAKYITLCMTCYSVSGIAIFLVMSVYSAVLVTICDAMGVVINLLGISMGYFGPKCYLIFFHPERNTAAYFQTAIQSYTMRQD
ncbi:taste receptor type 1 member 2 [Malaclemys terrapin pileata]|uniref:taste receptor type 1 member 2 n=1 Tax=Malaclemys terrapin pileata TaxID=2991368 RepID=UPI0023A89472|nr:taste receptor type 1 member 2 [Malaclemys terrapin pileata]